MGFLRFCKIRFHQDRTIDQFYIQAIAIYIMIEAIRTGNLNQVCLLLDEGTSPDVTDKHDVPALIIAASEGQAEIVEVLLAGGATWDRAIVQDSVTVPSEEWGSDRAVGAVTVWAAAKAGHIEVIQVLYDV